MISADAATVAEQTPIGLQFALLQNITTVFTMTARFRQLPKSRVQNHSIIVESSCHTGRPRIKTARSGRLLSGHTGFMDSTDSWQQRSTPLLPNPENLRSRTFTAWGQLLASTSIATVI